MLSQFLTQYGLFLAQAITIVLAVLCTVGGIVAIGHKKPVKNRVRFRSHNRRYDEINNRFCAHIDDKKRIKKNKKQHKKNQQNPPQRTTYLLNFDGDIKASQAEQLSAEITAILLTHQPGDRAIIRIKSGGGMVHGYGYAASQLVRLKNAGIHLTACIDQVAASGGYLMACVADHVQAAPFAIVGSIGVLAQLPNFHRWLDEHHIDFEQITAGEHKRTLTMFGKNSDKARDKMQSEIEATHHLFKQFVQQYRPQINIERVATGEHWYGQQAIDLGLVDSLQTSDDLIMSKYPTNRLIEVSVHAPAGFMKRFFSQTQNAWQAFKYRASHPTGLSH
jgi:serine protease SohB